MSNYTPSNKTAAILESAMGYIQSVEYQVGLRWVFYRLLQDGNLESKSDYERLKGYASKARKAFYKGWRPDTLVDSGREIALSQLPYGRGDVLRELHLYAEIIPDLFRGQDAVPFLLFEAATMDSQFKYFVPWVDRAAFRGDASIPHKMNIAKRCDELASQYDLPVHILYFGDYDKKGLQIPESAMADIRMWANTKLRFTRVGINNGDNIRFNLPEKGLKVGTYEWESLESDDAGTLIREGLESVIDMGLIEERIESANGDSMGLRDEIEQKLKELSC